MSEAKIEMKVGQITFSGQGEQEWVAKQLDKILAQAEKLVNLAPEEHDEESRDSGKKPMGKDNSIAAKTLPAFLHEKGANSNQVKKFLVTAVWLEAKGQNRLQTRDITKALKDAHQSRIGNATECLNQNVSKGYCEKDGKQFFVTDDGKRSL